MILGELGDLKLQLMSRPVPTPMACLAMARNDRRVSSHALREKPAEAFALLRLAASPTAKIFRRRTAPNFQTGA
jgi:hypothetical protein